jgi:site-specific recombinase XerD
MARLVESSRRCLPVSDWPLLDQRLWREALTISRDLEDDARGPAVSWRTTTIQTNREGYGRWINFLTRSGCDLEDAPGDRVTPARVRLYLLELRDQQISTRTQCNRIAQLLSVMLAIIPEHDWTWLKRRFNRLDAVARDHRLDKPPVLLSGDILDGALKALTVLAREGDDPSFASAVTYRNWLMLATITLVPLRRENFATLSISRHLRRVGQEWLVEIPAEETKVGKPIVMPIPSILYPYLQRYLERIRPMLLKGRDEDGVWITNRHGPITGHGMYIAMINFTRKVFDSAVSPHRIRHIGATSVVIAAPEQTEAARAFLGHGDYVTTEDHYIIAQSLAASRRRATLVAKLRRTLPGAKRAHIAQAGARASGDRATNG